VDLSIATRIFEAADSCGALGPFAPGAAFCAVPLGEMDAAELLEPSAGSASGAGGGLGWDAASCAGVLGVPKPSADAASDALGGLNSASCARALGELDALGALEPSSGTASGAVVGLDSCARAFHSGPARCVGPLGGPDIPKRSRDGTSRALGEGGLDSCARALRSGPARCVGPLGGPDIPKRSGDGTSRALGEGGSASCVRALRESDSAAVPEVPVKATAGALVSGRAPCVGPFGGLDIPKRSGGVTSAALVGLRSAPPCVGPLAGLDVPKRSGGAACGALGGSRSAACARLVAELVAVGAIEPSAGAASGAVGALAWDAASFAGALGAPEPFGNAASDALGRLDLACCARPLGKLDAVGPREPFAVAASFAVGAVTLGIACCAGALRRLDPPLRAAEPPEVLPRRLSVPC